MKPFDLKEYLEHPERKVITRDGRSAKIHCTNYYLSNFPIVAEIEDRNFSEIFTRDGYYEGDKRESPNDLFFASGEHREGWVNIYRNKTNGESYCGKIYASEEEAKTQTDILTTIKIEWEE